MILLYSETETSRLAYTLDLIFRKRLAWDITVTTSEASFLSYQGIRINYSGKEMTGIPAILPEGLLSSSSIEPLEVRVSRYHDHVTLFPSGNEGVLLPFDVFSAVFFMLSRYEEYLPFATDQHGRFPSTGSLASRYQFLSTPVVDHWIMLLAGAVQSSYPDHDQELQIRPSVFRAIPTMDIDVAYAYRHKGILRNLGGMMQSQLHLDFKGWYERVSVLAGLRPDPYDTYDYMSEVHRRFGARPLFFILLGDYGKNDKNLSHRSRHLRQLVIRLNQTGDTGIHPSYASHHEPEKVNLEISRLSMMTGKKITRSRQHFLLLSLPETYRRLIKCGIQQDYSMGYADQPGFRAGTSHPFPFFDLAAGSPTALTVFPLVVMDGTLKDYLDLDPQSAKDLILTLIESVKAVGGTFTFLWHNESLSDQKRWKGWRDVYEYTFSQCFDPVMLT